MTATALPVGDPVPGWTGAPPARPDPMAGRACSLVPLNAEAHTADLFAAFSLDATGANWTYLPYGPFADTDALKTWLRSVEAGTDPMFFAILDSKDKAVGVGSFMRIAPDMGTIEIGHIHLSPALQRHTAATEALALMMSRAMDDWGYRRLEWKCDALNAPSRRAAERLGFSYDGTFRKAAVVKGRNRDTAWFSIIDDDWPRVSRALTAWLDPANFDADGRQKARLSDLMSG